MCVSKIEMSWIDCSNVPNRFLFLLNDLQINKKKLEMLINMFRMDRLSGNRRNCHPRWVKVAKLLRVAKLWRSLKKVVGMLLRDSS
jgi:hypothetical protein